MENNIISNIIDKYIEELLNKDKTIKQQKKIIDKLSRKIQNKNKIIKFKNKQLDYYGEKEIEII